MSEWTEGPLALKEDGGLTVKDCSLIKTNSVTLTPEVPFKYDEPRYISELYDYVKGTYGEHYVGKDNVQAMDLIGATGHAISFCIGVIVKYATRHGKKKGQERKDILKILHYAMFLLYFYDKKEREANEKQPG